MRLKPEVNIDIEMYLNKLRDERLWTFAAYEWQRLITPYVPFETGGVAETVIITGHSTKGEIEYIHPAAHYLYHGELMVDPDTGSAWASKGAKKVYAGKELDLKHNKHPLSSKEWDKAAEPTQKPKLIQSVQRFIDMGGIKF